MRSYLVLLHRWFGLFMAIFLFIAGLTGAIISWDHELDAWLNPKLFEAQSNGEYQSALALANQLETNNPALQVTYLPLNISEGHTLIASVSARMAPATETAEQLAYNQIALDPVTGNIQGKRQWGAISLAPENLLPFLYKLHYTMHIPDTWGIEIGILFMGIIGIVWIFDCFIALWISFPNRKSWKKSFAFRFKQSKYKLNFDLHRSGGVWVWILLLILAITSVSMNLRNQVMIPVVSLFSQLSKSPFESRVPAALDKPINPGIHREAILTLADVEAKKRGINNPAGGIFYSPAFDIYGVGFFTAGDDHGDGGLGNPWLYFDGKTGMSLGAEIPGSGSAGDIFMQAQFPLHSGRILGLTGRILISAMGLVVAMLSLTGIIIWLRKRKAKTIRYIKEQHTQLANNIVQP